MPVESSNLQAACEEYALTLRTIAGSPPVLDLTHLGLGPDGHTASLVPGDAVLEIKDADGSRGRVSRHLCPYPSSSWLQVSGRLRDARSAIRLLSDTAVIVCLDSGRLKDALNRFIQQGVILAIGLLDRQPFY